MNFKGLSDDERYEAIEEGRKEGKLEMIHSFLAQGFPLEAIAKASGMSLDYIRGLANA